MNMQPINITNGVPEEIYVAIGRERYDHSGGDYELAQDVAMAIRAECKVEIERLRAVVDRIPTDEHTADGVYVRGDDTVYFPNGREASVNNYGSTPLAIIKGEWPGQDDVWEVRLCYSTREAAKAATKDT